MSANGKRLGRPPIYTPEERAERDRQKRREFDKKRLANLDAGTEAVVENR